MTPIEPFDLSQIPVFTSVPTRCAVWDAYVVENFYNMEAKQEAIRTLENIAERNAFIYLAETTDFKQEKTALRALTLLEMQNVKEKGNGSFLYRKIFDSSVQSTIVINRLKRMLDSSAGSLIMEFLKAPGRDEEQDVPAMCLIESLSGLSIASILNDLPAGLFSYPDNAKEYNEIADWMLDYKMIQKMTEENQGTELQFAPALTLLYRYMHGDKTCDTLFLNSSFKLLKIDDCLKEKGQDVASYYAAVLSIAHGLLTFSNSDKVANALVKTVTKHLEKNHPPMHKAYSVAASLDLPLDYKHLCAIFENKPISSTIQILPEI